MKTNLINYLKLVFPPISNQEADWLSDDQEVRSLVKHSNLYFIAQREEIFFENFKLLGKEITEDSINNITSVQIDVKDNMQLYKIQCDIVSRFHNEKNLTLTIPIELDETDEESIIFDFGPKLIRISSESGDKIYNWWTPDKLIFDYSRGYLGVDGFINYKKFTTYNLHYVGISKEDDSFTRLFNNGHKNRTKILSNETQLKATARLTDELMIFFFNIEDFGFRFMDNMLSDDELDEFVNGLITPKPLDKIKIISDAEKAFVSLLNCKYNKIKYKNYPKSKDGLYSEKLDSYMFQISEDLTFLTSTTSFVGELDKISQLAGRGADMIIIRGDNVSFMKSEDE